MSLRLETFTIIVAMLGTAACGATPASPTPAAKPTATAKVSTSPTKPSGTSSASKSSASKLRKITFLLDYIPEGDHAPFYYARSKGFFKAHGLDVKIVPGKGSANTVEEVGHGVYPIGFADASTAAIAISRGVPVVVVDDYFQRNPAALIYRNAQPLSKPSDVVGKTIAENPNGATAKLFTAFLSANHIPSKSVKIANMSASTQIPSLAMGHVSGVVTTEEVALPEVRAKGINAGALLFSDWGISVLSTGIIVNRTFLKRHPGVVQDFVTAANEGWKAAIAHPHQAIAAETKAVGTKMMPPNAIEMLKLSIPLLHTKLTKGRPLGWMPSKAWRETLSVLKRYFGLKHELPLNRYYTNRFVSS